MSMKKRHYTLAGLTLAALVFAVIVVAGLLGEETTPASEAAGANGDATTLPSGHPSVATGEGAGTGMGTTGGDSDLAAMITSLEKKYAQDPGDAETGAALADAYLMNEQADKAIKLYGALLDDSPGDPTLTAQLAMAWHVKGNDARAIQLLEETLAAAPKNQTAHYNLAIIYFAQNESAKAKQEWETAASIDPESRLGQSAQSFVDLMEGRTPAPTASSHGQ
jgi:Flp pilus assembly protein TadD